MSQNLRALLLVVGALALATIACYSDQLPPTSTPIPTTTPPPWPEAAQYHEGDEMGVTAGGAFFTYLAVDGYCDPIADLECRTTQCLAGMDVVIADRAIVDEEGIVKYYVFGCGANGDGWIPEDDMTPR